jgi:SAM-dependent methyltransferase
MHCPLCGQPAGRLFEKDGYPILRCVSCRHQFAEVAPSPDHVARVYADDYFHGGGAGYSDYLSEAAILRDHGRRYGRLLTRYTRPGTLLDVGAAAGFILQGLVDAGWQGEGVEPNRAMADYARSTLGLQVAASTLEDFPADKQYDVVSMIQIVPHFYDLPRALHKAAALTKPGGLWLVETWDRASWTARLLGRRWHEYSPPSVLHWFSVDGLKEFVRRFGFRQIARGRPSKRLNFGHARGLLTHKLNGSRLGGLAVKALGLIPDRVTIPYPAEDLFWSLFRKERGQQPEG